MAVFICSKAAFDQILCDFLNEFFDCWVQILTIIAFLALININTMTTLLTVPLSRLICYNELAVGYENKKIKMYVIIRESISIYSTGVNYGICCLFSGDI